MESLMLFLSANGVNILIITAFVMMCVWCYKNNKKKAVYFWLLQIVNEVEEKYGNDDENIKYSVILDRIYHALPSSVRWLFSIDELDNMITEVIDEVQYWLEQEIEDGK